MANVSRVERVTVNLYCIGGRVLGVVHSDSSREKVFSRVALMYRKF